MALSSSGVAHQITWRRSVEMHAHRITERLTPPAGLALGLISMLAGCSTGAASQRALDTSATEMPVGDSMVTLDAEALTWRPLQPPGFPPGMQVAVIHGDRTKPMPFTIRLRFPTGYRFPAHRHPAAEHLTVITGSLVFGAGERFDERNLRRYDAGDFLIAPAGMSHFGGASGETVVQLHGMGPFSITVVDPYVPVAAR
jgi:quercetin dioxygenase-like cupin family protein